MDGVAMDVNWIVDSPFEPLPVGAPEATALAIDVSPR